MISLAHAVNPWLYKLNYDPIKSFAAVGMLGSGPNIITVHPDLPVKSIKDLVALAKQKPGELQYASAGVGSFQHLGGELFKLMTGTQIGHVPYKSSGQAITELAAGQIHLIFDNLPSIAPHARSGRVRGLGVSSLKRSPLFPEIPTISEAGVPGYETNSWGGIVAPARTPRAIVMRLNAEINKALQSPTLKTRYAALEADPVGGTPQQFADFVKKERIKWADVVKRSGAKVD